MINYAFSTILGSWHNFLFNPQNDAEEVLSSPFLFTIYKHMRKRRLKGTKRELVSGESGREARDGWLPNYTVAPAFSDQKYTANTIAGALWPKMEYVFPTIGILE